MDGACGCTLGGCICGTYVVVDVVGLMVPQFGSVLTRFKFVTISSNALRIGSPACKDGVVLNGGCVKIVTISVVSCCKKLVSWTSGNLTFLGRKVTVAHILVLHDWGK